MAQRGVGVAETKGSPTKLAGRPTPRGHFTGKVRGGSAPARAIQPVAATAFQPEFKLDNLLVVGSCNPVRENRQVCRIWQCEPVGLVAFVSPLPGVLKVVDMATK